MIEREYKYRVYFRSGESTNITELQYNQIVENISWKIAGEFQMWEDIMINLKYVTHIERFEE